MPLPLIIGGALLATAVGVGANLSAQEKRDKAKRIGERAQEKYDQTLNSYKLDTEVTNTLFAKLGELKLDIFHDQMQHIVNMLATASTSDVKLTMTNFNNTLSVTNVKEIKHQIQDIGGLSVGAQMAIGRIALPAMLAIGLFMDSEAEEALAEATRYQAKTELAIGEIKTAKAKLESLRENVNEMRKTLLELVERFERVKTYDYQDKKAMHKMLMVGKGLKIALNMPLVNDDGLAKSGIKQKCADLLKTYGE